MLNEFNIKIRLQEIIEDMVISTSLRQVVSIFQKEITNIVSVRNKFSSMAYNLVFSHQRSE